MWHCVRRGSKQSAVRTLPTADCLLPTDPKEGGGTLDHKVVRKDLDGAVRRDKEVR